MVRRPAYYIQGLQIKQLKLGITTVVGVKNKEAFVTLLQFQLNQVSNNGTYFDENISYFLKNWL